MDEYASIELDGQNVDLNDQEAVATILGSAVLKLWDTVDDLTRLRPTTTKDYYVTIFGSARTAPGTELYSDIRRLARELAGIGCHIITGGGSGLMQAANEGASLGAPDHPERSVGIHIVLPLERSGNAFVGEIYQHKTFFSRLHHFVLRSNAFIVTTGGIGTTLELMMIWQLLQVRRLYDTPLVLLGDMWPELVGWARKHMVGRNLADPQDMGLPRCVGSIDEAIAIIGEHHGQWEEQKKKESKA